MFQPRHSLDGLSEFSHLWVIWGFHEKQQSRFHAKVHPPLMDGDSIGVFATRSPHRPNPIGLSLVEIVGLTENSVLIANHDLLDGTPVYDVKPYLAQYESIPNAKMGWRQRHQQNPMDVKFDSNIPWRDLGLDGLELEKFKSLISETLAQDPRPLIYRDSQAEQKDYRTEHVVHLHDWDVFFQLFQDEKAFIKVIRVVLRK